MSSRGRPSETGARCCARGATDIRKYAQVAAITLSVACAMLYPEVFEKTDLAPCRPPGGSASQISNG